MNIEQKDMNDEKHISLQGPAADGLKEGRGGETRKALLQRSEELRERAARLIETYGTSQSSLAVAIGIHRQTLCSWLSGKNQTMRSRTLDKLEQVIVEKERVVHFPTLSPIQSSNRDYLTKIREEIQRILGNQEWFAESLEDMSEDDLLRYFALCMAVKRKHSRTTKSR